MEVVFKVRKVGDDKFTYEGDKWIVEIYNPGDVEPVFINHVGFEHEPTEKELFNLQRAVNIGISLFEREVDSIRSNFRVEKKESVK